MLKASTAPVLGVPVDWFFFPSCFHSVNRQPRQFFSALFTFCLEPFSWGNSSEIGNFDIEVVEQDIFWLEAAVNDFESMAVVNAGNHLLEETPGLRLRHASMVDDIPE